MPQKRSPMCLQRTRIGAFIIVFLVLIAHIGAIAQFSRGFLLTRPVLPNFSTDLPTSQPAPFSRAVLIIVDALRYDFVVSPENEEKSELYFLNNFPLTDIQGSSFALKFIADPPTTTLQRLKGLTTGSLPAFVDAGSNFNGYKILEDNWVYQASKHLGPVSFVGDDTWESLFSHQLSEQHPFPSLNVRDLDTVDNGVKEHLPNMLKNTTNKIVIGHMLGVDHVGHRYGPSHPAMAKKQKETFEFIKKIASELDDKTVLMVMGDHGMDSTGNHGGDSKDEVEAALWVYSKRNMFNTQQNLPKQVNQIDLVPTLSGLLGFPIPHNSLGFPIEQAFANKKLFKELSNQVVDQIKEYAKLVKMPTVGGEGREFQTHQLEEFKNAWVQFDTYSMSLGILLLVLTVVFTILMINSSRATTLESIAYFQSVGAFAGAVFNFFTQVLISKTWVDRLISFCVHIGFGATLTGILGALYFWRFVMPSKYSCFAFVILAVEVATQFSNSYIIWESSITHYLLVTIFVVLAGSCARLGSPLVMYIGGWCSAVALFVLRLCSSWHVCREETAMRCVTTFFEPHSSIVPLWTYFGIGVLGLVLPYFLKRFWTIGKNNVGAAPLILNMSSFALMLTIAYASLDNAEARGWLSGSMRGLQSIKLLLGRFSLSVGMLGVFVWWNQNPPFEIIHGEKRPKINGLYNIYGADLMLPVVCVFWSLAVTNKPPAILSLAGLLYVCLCTLDLLDITTTKHTQLMPVIFDLLGQSFFYFTGHQATIPSIQWDSAFVAAPEVSYPWSPLTVFLNTTGSVIISTLACIFCSLWRLSVFTDCTVPVAFILRAISALQAVVGVRTVASMVSNYMLRRHLMTWKIFAPRFMIGGIALLTVDLMCLVALVMAGHTIQKVTKFFG